MINTVCKKYWKWIALLGSLLTLIGCSFQSVRYKGLQASITGTPLYTPIAIVAEGTELPPQAQQITIDKFVANPQNYEGEFIEIHGYNVGVYEKPACSPYIGPPTEWLLASALTTYKNDIAIDNPSYVEIKNTFGGMVNDSSDKYGNTIRNPLLKRVAIWGWVRLYVGGVGCQFYNGNGTLVPLEIKQVWYIEAVQMQFLESIEVNPPAK